MESKAKFLGHPIHQMMIVLPLGLFIASVVFDILFYITGNELFPIVAFYNIAGGILSGLAAAVFGFIDYTAIPPGTRAKRVGFLHGMGNVIVLLFFSFSWIIRSNVPGLFPETFSMVASLMAIGLAAVTGWLGGELVNRLGVGVDPGAHLNAPSSLSREPAMPEHRMQGQAHVPVTGEEGDEDAPL
jgi:uncharacterized membrane protein